MADLIGAPARGVVFGRSMTQLTYDVSRALAKAWGEGDEIVVSRLDHDANVRPWVQAAEAVGATVRWVDFDRETTELSVADVQRVLSPSTMLVAVTGASNLLGSRPDLPAIAAAVHSIGALLYVDGVHLTPHAPVDMVALGADFYACSPYKFLGPHCGVVAARPELWATLHPDKLLPATDEVPERFELGTLPYELLAGVTAAVDFHASLAPSSADGGSRRDRVLAGMAAVEEHEDALRARLESGLAELPGVSVWSRAQVAHAHAAADLRPAAGAGGVRVPGRARGQRPGRVVLRARAVPLARARRRGRSAGRARAVQQRGRRRPAARGSGRLPGLRPAGGRARPTRAC